jgi:enoyl-CoA hydratase
MLHSVSIAVDQPSVRIERTGEIVEVVLDRPDLLNRIDQAAHAQLHDAFEAVGADIGVRAVLFSSTGKAFSAGGDFDFILHGNSSLEHRRSVVRDGLRLMASLLAVPAPIVVALHGNAIGIAASLVLACDAVVSHPGASLSDPHVAMGLVAGDGGCLVWPHSAGMLMAKRHLLTGDPIDGELAHRMGLVTDLVPDAEAVPIAARALAERLAALPPLAVQGTKAALNQLVRHRFSEVMEVGLLHETVSLGSDDVREAVDAFRARRSPVFKGW